MALITSRARFLHAIKEDEEDSGGPPLKPLILPCGHPCSDPSPQDNSVHTCHTCNTKYKVHQDSPALKPNDIDMLQPTACPIHGDPLRMWCEDCESPACGLCMFDQHPKEEHRVVRAHSLIIEKKKNLLINSHTLLRQATRKIRKNEEAFHACEVKLIHLFRENKELHKLHNSLRALNFSVENATSLASLHQAEKDLRRIKAHTWTESFYVGLDQEDGDGEPSDRRSRSRQEALGNAMESLGIWINKGDGRQARLVWDMERLLLCAFTEPIPSPHPVLQFLAVESLGAGEHPEVFLELSVDRTPLGVVYIKLWGHLRRAQNFLLLCLGTLGPSLVGSHLLPINSGRGTPEAVMGGEYKTAEGGRSSAPLLSSLEWGGPYQTQLKEGLVVGFSGGKQDKDSMFSIVTGKSVDGLDSRCKFGWVVSGLDFVREASSFEPGLDQVWVSQCGLVLSQASAIK